MGNFLTKVTSVVGGTAILVATLSTSLVAAASEFLPYAQVLADNDVISSQQSEIGYRLGDNVTRAELAKIVANLGGFAPTSCMADVYSDVGSTLGDLCGYIEALAEGGVVSTSNATFRPAANVTRAEMVKMILAALGEEGSMVDAGYMDVAGLGDLAGFINRANEIGCAKSSSYFRPASTSSRGEAFKIAACAAGLDIDTAGPGNLPPTGTGTTPPTGTGTTPPVMVASGALSVALDGTASAQYVPKNASSVKVGSIKLTAGANPVTIQSLVVSRSGLGNSNDITSSNGIRAAQHGVVISSTADYYNPTSQKATVYFSPALVVAAGSSQMVDILVNLSGAENSQHQFTLDMVNASNTTVTGAPVTLGLLNTTSYVAATTTASLSTAGGTITTGKSNQLFAKLDISAGGRESKVTGFTITRSGSTDFTKRLTNVKVYKNGVSVGTVTLSSEKLSVSGLADVLSSGNTQTYELRGDILIDANSNVMGLKIDATTDINAVEMATGYSTQVTLGTSAIAITFGSVEFTFSKTSTGNVTLAPGVNNIKLFAGKLQSKTPVSVRMLTITPTVTGTGIAGFVNDQLSVKLNGSEIATLTSLVGAQARTVSFVVDEANPAMLTIEGSTKNNTNIAPSSYQFTVTLTEVRDSSNNSITSLGAGSSLTGDKTTVNTAEVELKQATIAAPSTSRVYSSAEQEIGRFAVTARNEVARVQSITLPVSVSTGSIQAISNSTSSAKLVDVSTNAEVSATVTISGNTITFSSMNDTIGKDITKNYKVLLGVTSVDAYYGMTLKVGSSTGALFPTVLTVVRDSNSTAITPTGMATTKTYTIGTVAPTVLVTTISENTFKVRVTNPDTNTGITLTGAKFDFKTALPGNTSYTASGCLRDQGNSNTCGGFGTTASAPVPALAQTISVTGLTTNMTADKNGGYVEFEVYVTSASLLPSGGQLQVALTQLFYSVGAAADTETYVGTTGASATFTK